MLKPVSTLSKGIRQEFLDQEDEDQPEGDDYFLWLAFTKRDPSTTEQLDSDFLEQAILYRNLAAVKYLLKRNIKVEQTFSSLPPSMNTPLLFAIFKDDLKIVDLLLQAGADPSLRNNFAVKAARSIDMIERLIVDPRVKMEPGDVDDLQIALRTGQSHGV